MKYMKNKLVLLICFCGLFFTGCSARFTLYDPPLDGDTATINLDADFGPLTTWEKIDLSRQKMDFYFFDEKSGCPSREHDGWGFNNKNYNGAISVNKQKKAATISIPAGEVIYIKASHVKLGGWLNPMNTTCKISARFAPEANKHYIFTYRKQAHSCSAALNEISENNELVPVTNARIGHIENICPQ